MKISTDIAVSTLHPRENLWATGTLASVNAEVIVNCDGASSFSLDLRGTFSGTIELSGTVDGTNWVPIPVRALNVAGIGYVATIVGTTQGAWVGKCGQFRKVRARETAHTSGSFTATLMTSNALLDDSLQGMVTPVVGTVTAAIGVAATLTLASPGAGLRHYLTYLSINRFAGALLSAAATPVLVTTTNIPGTLVFSMPADAAAQGTIYPWREDFAYPLAVSAQSTATTIVAPATTGVIWRITAGYYVAP